MTTNKVGFITPDDEEINNEDGGPLAPPGDATEFSMPANANDDTDDCSKGLTSPDDSSATPEQSVAATPRGSRRVSFQDDFPGTDESSGNVIDGGEPEENSAASSSNVLPSTPGRKVHFNKSAPSLQLIPEAADAPEKHRAGPAVSNFSKDVSKMPKARRTSAEKQPALPLQESAAGTPRVYRKVRSGRFANLKVTLEEPPNDGMPRSQSEMPSNPGGNLERFDLRIAGKEWCRRMQAREAEMPPRSRSRIVRDLISIVTPRAGKQSLAFGRAWTPRMLKTPRFSDLETPRTPGGGLRLGRALDRRRGSIKKQRSRSEDGRGGQAVSPVALPAPKRSETLFGRMATLRPSAEAGLAAIEAKNRTVSVIKRVATIIMAEYPLELLHKSGPGDEDDGDSDGDYDDPFDSGSDDDAMSMCEEILQTPKERFQESCITVIMARNVRRMRDRSKPLERWFAIMHLESMIGGHNQKHEIVAMLASISGPLLRKAWSTSLRQTILMEMRTTLERWQEWLMPAEMDKHKPYFSALFTALVLVPFFHMTGAYSLTRPQLPCPGAQLDTLAGGQATGDKMPPPPDFAAPSSEILKQDNASSHGERHAAPCLARHGPMVLFAWIDPFAADMIFSGEFLREWGGRYGPDMADGQSYRWLTSVVIHQSFMHVLSNWLLMMSTCPDLEIKYGAWRVAVLWLISCLGGELVSSMWESNCQVIVGASGGVFGIMGLFVADMFINFKTIRRPILRCIIILIIFAFSALEMSTTVNVSGLSHVGGFICGFSVSFLLLPRVRKSRRRLFWRRAEICMTTVAVLILLVIFVLLPVLLYRVKFHPSATLEC